jgi:hypothetical protein
MKRDDPIVDGGTLALVFGAVAFFPPMLDREFLITAWLGVMQQPVGLSAMVVGAVLVALGKLREFRNGSPVASPTDAAMPGLNEVSYQPANPTDLAPSSGSSAGREPGAAPPA